MRQIIQGEKSTFVIDLVDSTGKRIDLTGNTEIEVCFKGGTTVVSKKKSLTEVTVVGAEADGQISTDLTVANTGAFAATSDGAIEISVDYGSGDIRKAQITEAFQIIEKLCP